MSWIVEGNEEGVKSGRKGGKDKDDRRKGKQGCSAVTGRSGYRKRSAAPAATLCFLSELHPGKLCMEMLPLNYPPPLTSAQCSSHYVASESTQRRRIWSSASSQHPSLPLPFLLRRRKVGWEHSSGFVDPRTGKQGVAGRSVEVVGSSSSTDDGGS
ncbi:hypothetical protein M0804_007514 [Polistes exclamans]|nr:hypothetical protein M0804_007514 [Polistes exclamans]